MGTIEKHINFVTNYMYLKNGLFAGFILTLDDIWG